jgi:hypothetical protein
MSSERGLIGLSASRLDELVLEFGLNLSGIPVITECATGVYSLLGPLAARAGSPDVICLGRDNQFGSYEEARRQTLTQGRKLSVYKRLKFFRRSGNLWWDTLAGPVLVTNMSGVRPIDEDFIRRLEEGSVISAMFEAWELRDSDIDLQEALKSNISVVATNESHPLLQSIRSVGLICLKLMLEASIPIADARLIVIGDDPFSQAVVSALSPWTRETRLVTETEGFVELPQVVESYDAVIVADHRGNFADHPTWRQLVAVINRQDVPVINVSGFPKFFVESCPSVFPRRLVEPRVMPTTLESLGAWPALRLLVAGLKVGQMMWAASRSSQQDCDDESLLMDCVWKAQTQSKVN